MRAVQNPGAPRDQRSAVEPVEPLSPGLDPDQLHSVSSMNG